MTNCLVVTEDKASFGALATALAAVGVSAVGVGSPQPFDAPAAVVPTSFAGSEATVRRAEATVGPVDAVLVVSPAPTEPADPSTPEWERLLSAHAHVDDHILAHAGWARAAARVAREADRPVRVVHVTPVRAAADDSAAQAVTQLARSALDSGVPVPFLAFSVSYEGHSDADLAALAQLCARLVWADAAEVAGVAGAELVVAAGWVGIRRHPGPTATVSYGGPEIPGLVLDPLREEVLGRWRPEGARR